jgi:transcriptional regulator with XRE-family HTH domain
VADQSQPVRCNGSLWRLRHERNLSRRDLAELTGVSQKTIVDILRPARTFRTPQHRKLAKALKVEPEVLAVHLGD